MSILKKIFDKLRRKGVQVAPNKAQPKPAQAPKLSKELQELMIKSPFPHCIIEQEFSHSASATGQQQPRTPTGGGRSATPEPVRWGILDVSSSFGNMMGILPDDMVGKDWFEYVDPKVSDKLIDQLSGSGPDFRMKTVLMSRATYVDEEGMAASASSDQSSVPLKVDLLGVVVPDSKYLIMVVLSVSLMQNLVRMETMGKEGADDQHAVLQRNKSMSKSFVLRQVDLTSRNLARMPSFLRPQRYPQQAENKRAGQEAVQQLNSEDMQEALAKSRKRRDKRIVQLNDETFDEKCKRWLSSMVDFFNLPADSEASFTLKLWASTMSKGQMDPGFVPLKSIQFDDSDDDEIPERCISPTTAANTLKAAGPIEVTDDEAATIKRTKSTKVVNFSIS